MSFQIEVLNSACIKPYREYKYKVCQDINLMINGSKFIIPADFITDLASIPKMLWPLLAPSHSALFIPAIVHDWFYRMTGDFTRDDTDLIFYQMMLDYGLNKAVANAIYYAVRAFGKGFYNDIKS